MNTTAQPKFVYHFFRSRILLDQLCIKQTFKAIKFDGLLFSAINQIAKIPKIVKIHFNFDAVKFCREKNPSF